MISLLDKVQDLIIRKSVHSQEKSEHFAEVFTPVPLIQEMVDTLPIETWTDKTKTFLDPCAGLGNYPIVIIKKYFKENLNFQKDPEAALKHIVENQLFMAEYQRESAEFIATAFTFGKDFKVNLYVGNTLEMPEDFFDLSWEERREKYPENCIID